MNLRSGKRTGSSSSSATTLAQGKKQRPSTRDQTLLAQQLLEEALPHPINNSPPPPPAQDTTLPPADIKAPLHISLTNDDDDDEDGVVAIKIEPPLTSIVDINGDGVDINGGVGGGATPPPSSSAAVAANAYDRCQSPDEEWNDERLDANYEAYYEEENVDFLAQEVKAKVEECEQAREISDNTCATDLKQSFESVADSDWHRLTPEGARLEFSVCYRIKPLMADESAVDRDDYNFAALLNVFDSCCKLRRHIYDASLGGLLQPRSITCSAEQLIDGQPAMAYICVDFKPRYEQRVDDADDGAITQQQQQQQQQYENDGPSTSYATPPTPPPIAAGVSNDDGGGSKSIFAHVARLIEASIHPNGVNSDNEWSGAVNSEARDE